MNADTIDPHLSKNRERWGSRFRSGTHDWEIKGGPAPDLASSAEAKSQQVRFLPPNLRQSIGVGRDRSTGAETIQLKVKQ
jgi:hypothetical protein